jgi:hypothetical protein
MVSLWAGRRDRQWSGCRQRKPADQALLLGGSVGTPS